jgi:hypothetical protein
MSRQLFLLAILALPAVPAAAQDLAEPLSVLPPARRQERSGPLRLQEVFLADGVGDTLSLGWRCLRWGSAVVRLEGRTLRPDLDYTLDYPGGVCRLAAVPPAGSVVEVRYALVPRLSSSTTGESPAPAAGVDRAPGLRPAGERLAAALRSRRQALLNGFSPARGAMGEDGSAEVTSSGLREQLESGLRQTEVNQQLAGDSGTGRVSYFRADPFDPRSVGDAREEFNSQLNLRPSPTSKLLVDNYFSRGSLFADEYEESERRRVQFDQKWDKSAASLLWEHRRSDGYGVASALDALSLSLNRTVTSNLSAEGLFILRDSLFLGRETQSGLTLRQGLGSFADARGDLLFRRSSFSGDTLESGLTLSAQPGRNDLQVALRQSDSELFGRFQRFGGQIDSALTSRVQVHGEASLRSAESLGGVFTYGLGLTAQPTTRSLLETAFSQSTGEKTGRDQSQSFRVSVDPSSALRFQVGFDRLDSSKNGLSQNSMWIVTVGGQRYVRFEGYSGLYAMQEEGDYSDALYRLEVRPAPALAFSGSLRAVSEQDQMRQLAGVGATLRVLPGVDLSANYRQPRGPGTSPQDPFGRDLRLSLAPAGSFRVFGEYSVRPEDAKGLLLDQTHRTVGLETKFGSFGLEGSVTSLDDPTTTDPGRSLDLLASLRLGAGTRLYGGLRSLDNSLTDDVRSRIYRLGISQNAGESFFVLLEGQLGWLVDSNGARTRSADDTRAQARFGLRF